MFGTTVNATTNDATNAYVIVNANGISISPTVPFTYIIGKNTQIVVSVDATIGAATCFAPCTAARGADKPLFLKRYIFSMTTIELSTNIPIPRQSPARDITFNVMPVKYIIRTADITLNGILNATISVGFTSFKNNAKTIIARIAPSNMLCKTVLTIIFM